MLRIQDCALDELLYHGPEIVVYRVTHRPSGERLIVKTPAPEAPSKRALGRLVHERAILQRLAAVSGVVRARGLEREGEYGVLWLEDSGLRSLDRALAERGRLPLADGLRVACELARVLQRVHAAGVVHKDIKPHNILWDGAGAVQLLDFSIASELVEEAIGAGPPEVLEGTLGYISPEQTGRTARGLDARTDLYSFGVVLFELLAGRRPFLDTDPLALVHAHLAKAPPALDEVAPGLPEVVARLVARCLEKHPERRYQTAKGLAFDLERCLGALTGSGAIEPFALGERDFSPALQLPHTLLGRDAERRAIAGAFERAAGGAAELLLVGGPSGIGKTALVRSVYGDIARAGRGLLLAGKHDLLGRSAPYAALAQAFGGLLRDLAASPKPVFDAWRARIDRALGPLARAIADIVPELEWLLGPPPPLPVVPTDMAYNRLKLAWIEFVRAVAAASPPLVLFLDDMQWADPASLELLKTLLTDVGRRHLLVIAAYRDDEADPRHPLWRLVEAVDGGGMTTTRFDLRPLDEAAVREWTAAALASEPARVAALADVLARKTHGNPFFLRQLLLELTRVRAVFRDLDTGVWQWDDQAVARAAVTDNVVALMRRRLVELPGDTQALLGRAACTGHEFSLTELTLLSGLARVEVVELLRPALTSGLVVPRDGHYREAQALAQASAGEALDAGYRFLHDRVQQAFYERIAPEQRAQTHLSIGRRLRAAFEQRGGAPQRLLELTRHLDLGAEALATDAERRDLARLNLRAARAAKASGSHRLQATLVERAQALAGPRHEDPALADELALERLEAAFMLREFDDLHRRADELLARPLPPLPRLAALELRVRACLACGQYAEGERLGMLALAEQGVAYPESNDACVAGALELIARCDDWLDGHPEGFSTTAADPSPEHALCDAIEAAMLTCAAFGSRPALGAYGVARCTLQAIERRSLTPVAPFFVVSLASARSAFTADYVGSVRWTREGEQAAARLGSPLLSECVSYHGFYAVYEAPVARSRESYDAALRAATAAGSFQGTSWGLVGELYYLVLWQGRPLAEVAAKEQERRDMMTRSGDAIGQHFFALAAAYAEFLRAPQAGRSPADEWLTAGSRTFLAMGDGFVAEFARIQEAHLFLAFGEFARALERAEEAELLRPSIYGLPPVTYIPLWRGLAAARCWSPTLPDERRAALAAIVEQSVARVRGFALGCPENFLHKLRLLEAEQARLRGDTDAAMAAYEEAVELARREGFLHIEALAAQLCGEYHLHAGRARIAGLYLHAARDAYARWGAHALVAHLEASHPALAYAPAAAPPRAAAPPTATTTDTTGGLALDVSATIRAAQALSSELDPTRVVARLMDIVLSSAGAQRGALVLVEGDALVVVARMAVGVRIETGLTEPLDGCRDVAATVVRYVARTREPVVVPDAASEARFADDPRLAGGAVRSLLALPLTHRGRVSGVLALEHGDAPSAFPASRVELLAVIAAQAAIAVENATLYQNAEKQVRELTALNREIRLLNDELRRQVAQRSRGLLDALSASDSSMNLAAGQGLAAGALLGDCYKIVRPLGRGGMGVVYEVERTTDGTRLAAKVMHHCADARGLGRFVREAQTLAMLSHPHLLAIFDVDLAQDGVVYIVMEHLQGADLATLVRDHGALPPARVVHFAVQACTALAEVHRAGIAHRDVKPENLFVVQAGDEHDFLKLLDFGLARVIETEGEADLTRPGMLAGTPAFMAPEVCRGDRADARSDLYALGATMYLLLTGSPPFVGATARQVIAAHLDRAPERPSLLRGEPVPEALERLVLRCLAKQPDDRFQTAQELRAALADLPADVPWTADDARRFWQVERPAKLGRWGGATLDG